MNKTDFGKCVWDDNMIVLSSNTKEATMAIEESSETSDYFPELLCFGQSDSEYESNVTVYIAGFIQKCIMEKIECSYCFTYLRDKNSVMSSALIDRKDLGGLVRPSEDVNKLVSVCDNFQ